LDYYTNPTGTALWSGHLEDTYLRYRVSFSTANPLVSPTLSDIVFTYAASVSLTTPGVSGAVKPGDVVFISGAAPILTPNPAVAVSVLDEHGVAVPDGVASSSVTVASDGTVTGSVTLGAMKFKRGNATKVYIEVTVTETGGRVSKLSTPLMALAGVETGFKAYGNRINPLQGEKATLRVEIARAGRVVIRVFTSDGVPVTTLADAEVSSGVHTWEWSGVNSQGEVVASGIYMVHVTGPDLTATQKVAVVK